MCTLTLVPHAGGVGPRVRIGFNRDERIDRPKGLLPQVRRCGPRLAIMPIDPVSDGSWIAVNDAGLVAGLLNQYGAEPTLLSAGQRHRSRGDIVPLVMGCSTIEEPLDRIYSLLKRDAFAPFRLIFTDGSRYGEIRASGRSVVAEPIRALDGPKMFTSSSLGDALVQAPRKLLFAEMFDATGDIAATQDAFHRHRWRSHPELSVCMTRPEACTVSYTWVEVCEDEANMTYYPAPPGERCTPTRICQPAVKSA